MQQQHSLGQLRTLLSLASALFAFGCAGDSGDSGDSSTSPGGSTQSDTTGGSTLGGSTGGSSTETSTGSATTGATQGTGGGTGGGNDDGASSTTSNSNGATGGASNMGMTASGGSGFGGATGSSGGGGSTTGADCTPVNPNATQQAKNLLCYLYDIYEKGVLSGQQETSWDWNNPGGNDIQAYVNRYGVYPAVLGGDYLYNRGTGATNGTTDRALAYWEAGGIPLIRYHMGAPPQQDSYEASQSNANIDNVLAPGTTENNSFNGKLDYVAGELLRLQDAGAAVLWAPFHEFQQDGWFWWSKGSASQFKQLWQYMFDRLIAAGVNNVVWLAPSSGTPLRDWYPDKSQYDIAGPDTYANNPPFTQMFDTTRGIVGSQVPIPLHETGSVPDPASMFPASAPWVLFNVWAEYGLGGRNAPSSMANYDATYNSEYTITRDEVPDLK